MLRVKVPPAFSFLRGVYSHGWFDLPPFRWDGPRKVLHRVIRLPGSAPIEAGIEEGRGGGLLVRLHGLPAGAALRAEVRRQVRHILRLDEPLEEYHALCRRHPGYEWAATEGAGRLLRAPDPFEDLVKLLCTTNCSWALTRSMIRALVEGLGEAASNGPASGVALAFPTAGAMADAPLRFYVRRMRAGYRAAYIRDAARAVAAGDVQPDRWLDPALPSEEVREEILRIRGAGRYVADNMMKLLGRYDGLGLDSWCRRKFAEIHRRGRHASDAAIERHYERFGRYRGLALWCDLTRDWFSGGMPQELRLRSQKL